jgi:hypothetical protein
MQRQMPYSHPAYKVKKSDTLAGVSERLGMDEDVWITYHNKISPVSRWIWRDSFPVNTEEIYLPPELWEKADELNSALNNEEIWEKKTYRKIKFGFDTTPLHYSVALTLTNDETVNTIKYEISVRQIAQKNNHHYIEINKEPKIYINNEEPDLMFDVSAVKAASALYPLVLVVTPKAGIVSIDNMPDIQKRWENIKQEIRKYYSSETLEQYLHLNNEAMQSEEILRKSLRNDWFLHAYFNNIYQDYGRAHSIANRIVTPFILDAACVEYSVQQTINPTGEEDNFIKIEMNGEHSLNNLETQYKPENKQAGTYYAEYFIDAQHHIDTVRLDCSIELITGNKKISLISSRINK